MAIEIDRLLLGDDTKSVRGKSIGRWCWPILSSNRSRITEPIENVWAKGWDALATLWKRYLPRSVWPRAEIRRPTAQRDGHLFSNGSARQRARTLDLALSCQT